MPQAKTQHSQMNNCIYIKRQCRTLREMVKPLKNQSRNQSLIVDQKRENRENGGNEISKEI